MATISKEQLQQIFDKAPPEMERRAIVEGLLKRGNTIEGLNMSSPSSQAAETALGRPLSEEGKQKALNIDISLREAASRANELNKGAKLNPETINRMTPEQLTEFLRNNPNTAQVGKEAFLEGGITGFAKGAIKGVGSGIVQTARAGNRALEATAGSLVDPLLSEKGRQRVESQEQFQEESAQNIIETLTPEENASLAEKVGSFVGEEAIPFIAGGGLANLVRGGFIKFTPKATSLLGKGASFIGRGATEGSAAVAGYDLAKGESPTAEGLAAGAALGPIAEGGIKVAGKAIGKVVNYLKTPKGTRQIQKAGDEVFRAIKPRLTKGRNLDVVKDKYATANSEIVSRGFKPDDLESYTKAIKDTKTAIWKDLETQLKKGSDQNLDINLKAISEKVRKMANNSALKRTSKSEVKKLNDLADDLVSEGERIGVLDAEDTKQLLNAELEGLFGEINISKPVKEAKKLITRQIGKQLDDILSTGRKGQFQDLKIKYGALREIEDDVMKRFIVFERQNPQSLVESLSRVAGLGNVAKGIVKLSPSEIGKGLVELTAGRLAKQANDANRLVKSAFDKLIKNIPREIAPAENFLRPLLPAPSGKPLSAQNVNLSPITLPTEGGLDKTRMAIEGAF